MIKVFFLKKKKNKKPEHFMHLYGILWTWYFRAKGNVHVQESLLDVQAVFLELG